MYRLVVGEIGIPRNEYLYELPVWEIRLIIDGYRRRSRERWTAIRWQTFMLMQVGMADMQKSGFRKPSDLLAFPWDDEVSESELSEEEIEEMKMLLKERG